MDCRMGRGIYLRANGEINCHCSTEEQVALAELPLEGEDWNFMHDFSRIYFSGRGFTPESIRELPERIGVDALVLEYAYAGFTERRPKEQP